MRSMEILDQKHIQNEYNPSFHKPESLSAPKLFFIVFFVYSSKSKLIQYSLWPFKKVQDVNNTIQDANC